MKNYWHDIPATDKTIDKNVNAIIEIPKGSKGKYEYDKKHGLMMLDRVLYTSMQYPANYGFIPQTLGDDSDPLDILVLCTENIPSGVLVHARVVGVFIMVDDGEMDEKILAVAADDPQLKEITEADKVPKHIIDEMTHFFESYKQLQKKKTEIKGFKGRDEALKIIEDCQKKYQEKYGK